MTNIVYSSHKPVTSFTSPEERVIAFVSVIFHVYMVQRNKKEMVYFILGHESGKRLSRAVRAVDFINMDRSIKLTFAPDVPSDKEDT